MSAIHQTTKVLFSQALDLLVEAAAQGNDGRVADLRKTLEEVFNNTVDDNVRLQEDEKKELP